MTTVDIAAINDAYIYGKNALYASARAESFAIVASTPMIGQLYYLSNYYVYRTKLSFDTSSIGAGAVITQVNLKMTLYLNQSTTAWDLQIVKYNWNGISDGEVLYDGILNGEQDESILCDTSAAAGARYTSGNLSTDWINKTGITYYGLRSSADVLEIPPTGFDRLYFYGSTALTSRVPVLTVTYTEAVTGALLKVNFNAQMNPNLSGGIRG